MLQTSDHFYYMWTKWSNDGDVHAYFSPYQSPYDAYIAFMNALSDLQLRVSHAVAEREEREAAQSQDDTEIPEDESVENSLSSFEDFEKEFEQPSPPRKWWQKIIDFVPFFSSPKREVSS